MITMNYNLVPIISMFNSGCLHIYDTVQKKSAFQCSEFLDFGKLFPPLSDVLENRAF